MVLSLGGSSLDPPPVPPVEDPAFPAARARMVRDQLVSRGIRDARVLAALGKVPRQEFVPKALQAEAYQDGPLPIGHGQTISQPYVVAFMTEALVLRPRDRVLEIGTGSGYQAAVLAGLVAEVFSIELVEPLAHRAEADLRRLGYGNIKVRAGDGYRGWPEAAPFDAILVTCAPEQVPEALVEQLRSWNGINIANVGPQPRCSRKEGPAGQCGSLFKGADAAGRAAGGQSSGRRAAGGSIRRRLRFTESRSAGTSASLSRLPGALRDGNAYSVPVPELEGRMIVPVGSQGAAQELILLRKTPEGLERQAVLPVRFVPMVKHSD